MDSLALDLTDLLDFDVDDPAAADGAMVVKSSSDAWLSPPLEVLEPEDLAPEALCLFYDEDDTDTCDLEIIDDDDDEEALSSTTADHVVAFNGGRSRDAAVDIAECDLTDEQSLHTLAAHRMALTGPPLDAVQMLLRSQVPQADRAATPDCVASVIKAHHDLRFWDPLLGEPGFTGHVSDFLEDLGLLRTHRPPADRTTLWALWKDAHDQVLALLPEHERLSN